MISIYFHLLFLLFFNILIFSHSFGKYVYKLNHLCKLRPSFYGQTQKKAVVTAL